MSIENEIDRRVSVALQDSFTFIRVFLNPIFEEMFFENLRMAAEEVTKRNPIRLTVADKAQISLSYDNGDRLELECRFADTPDWQNFYYNTFYNDSELINLINLVCTLRKLYGKADGG